VRSRHLRFGLLLSALTLALPGLARADISKVWLVPGAGAVWPNSAWGDSVESPTLLYGGILGFSLSPAIALEFRGSITEPEIDSNSQYLTGGNLTLNHVEGNLTWFLTKRSMFAPYLTLGAGTIHEAYEIQNVDQSTDEFAWNFGGGFRIGLASRISIRLDGRGIFYPVWDIVSQEDVTKSNFEAFGGLSFGFGGKQPDADMDGVQNHKDKCPDTPRGALVDANGCPLDGDGDGVFDGLDQCANTPKGATVDASGCPSDSDKDGVLNGIDTCPDTPAGATVDLSGCPSDSDKDGVVLGIDQCPSTPIGCTVDAKGCQTDSDGDGVCDGLDKCPSTPTTVQVDKAGCPIEVTVGETELLETGLIRIQDVNFDTGKATIKPASYPRLDEIGTIMSKWSTLRIEIGGYTDNTGSEALNQKLSEERAKAVLDYILGKFPGIQPDQHTSVGYGESKPIESNATATGRAKNRRVEFKVLNTEALKQIREEKQMVPKE